MESFSDIPGGVSANRLSRRQWLLLLSVVAVGLALRLYRLSLSGFLMDEAWLSVLGSQVGHLKRFTPVGVRTSFGFMNPPFLAWFLAPVYVVSPNPLGVMGLIAVLGSAGVLLTGLSVSRLYGFVPAIAVTVCMAFAPNAVEHSRRIWGHDFIVFWAALSVYSLLHGLKTERARWYVLSMAAVVFAQSGHLSGALLWALPLTVLLWIRPKRWKRALVVVFFIALLNYLPWLLHDALTQDFADMKIILSLLTGRAGAAGEGTPVAAWMAWLGQLSDGFHIEMLDGIFDGFIKQTPLFFWMVVSLRGLMALLAVGGLLVMTKAAFRSPFREQRALQFGLVLTALAPLLLFTALPSTSVPSYQLPALVALAVGVGALTHWFHKSCKARVFKFILFLLLFFVAVSGTVYNQRLRERLNNARFGEGYTMTLKVEYSAMRYILRQASDKKFTIQQDIRPPGGGIDLWFVYLHYALTGESSVPVNRPDASEIFLIQTRPFKAYGPAADLLARHSPRNFGAIRVWHFTGNDAALWSRFTQISQQEN